jgi:hypothetical protein
MIDALTPGTGSGIAAFFHGRDGDFYGIHTYRGPFLSGMVFRLSNPAPCDNTLTARYKSGTLTLSFTFRTETPAVWVTWVVAAGQNIPLWFFPTAAVSPAAVFSVPIPNVPNVGRVTALTFLVNQTLAVCGDRRIVDTGGL